jgi:hypothetical protein
MTGWVAVGFQRHLLRKTGQHDWCADNLIYRVPAKGRVKVICQTDYFGMQLKWTFIQLKIKPGMSPSGQIQS